MKLRQLIPQDPAWRKLKDVRQTLVPLDLELNLVEIKNRGWSTVARPSYLFGDPQLAGEIEKAVTSTGSRSFFAIDLDTEAGSDPVGFEIEANLVDVLKFSATNSYFSYLFSTIDTRFAVILTTNEYLIAAGEAGFIDALSGGSRDMAIREFSEFTIGRSMLPEYNKLRLVESTYNGL